MNDENPDEILSPYDIAYPISFFSSTLHDRLNQADSAAERVYAAVAKSIPSIAQIQQATQKGCRYVVDATDSTIDAIETGKIKLTTENGGKMYAQIRDSSGHYGSKLPIKREEFRKGLDPVQMANALQMKALQEQIEAISEQIHLIDQSVKEVLQGQQNDRIGLYYSGMALYIEAQNIADATLKQLLTSQALRSLSEASFQLTLTMQSDIRYLVDGEYKKAKGKRVELVEQKMQAIHQSFAFIHQSTMMRAAIYCNQGELSAMSAVLNEYSYFISETVGKNAGLLAECDTSDSGTEAGIWKSRAKLKLDVADFTKEIKAPKKVIYLGVSKEDV